MAKADTAYTNIALPAHTDTTYFTDPAGLQAFHMLSHTALEGSPPTGGESLLVDGFHAAEIMRKEHKHEFQVLKTCSVPWHASGNQGVTITPGVQECVIRSYATPKAESPIYRIKWNNDDRGVMRLTQNTRNVAAWYGAARKFNDILKRTSSEYWFQLKPGRTLIFDNYRVLHGRSAFTGLRRMCGGYISRDDFVSRWRNTNFARDEVLAQVLG
ncbi:Clavaminate synthase-like protein [Cryphonectria parasitica EP155]|uniref:Clavaminate synthase-like protein n=1 Tax=Cryphonectria parasitica (strain ATCC 38755 / EP155) TaxID=660469 RepID=A0A9P5CU34_CRYP1|nr:Clavaminate synthase-like protein [Cryphonectria parasitica EP155]KAF3770988.1 Clavaminate synthase-like protein [Cryphonectria parasitica EP155]